MDMLLESTCHPSDQTALETALDSERYQNQRRIRVLEGEMAFHLDVFGDYLAKREDYKDVSGIDAVHFYLVHKFGWFPAQVRAMTAEDLRFVLAEEMQGWTLPAEARN